MSQRHRLVLAASLLLGCGPGAVVRRPPAPLLPPEPTQITLDRQRVTHVAWTSPPAAPLPRNRRGITPEVAQPILMTANDPVRACYKAFLAFSPEAAGSITTLMRVGADGTVSDVETVGSPDPSLALIQPCVLNAVRSRHFPASRSSALVSYTFTLHTGDPTPNAAASPVSPMATTPGGAHPRTGEVVVLNPEVITARAWGPMLNPNAVPAPGQTRDLVAEALPDITSLIDTCYAAGLVMAPDLSGSVNLRFSVEPSGSVAQINVDTMPPLPPLQQCLSTLGQRLRFQPARNGALVTIPVTLSLIDNASAVPPGAPTGPTMPASTVRPSTGLMPVTQPGSHGSPIH